MKKELQKTIMVPPDGGWGWMICFAHALSNIIIIPIFQSFGLIFKPKFVNLRMSATDASIIVNVHSAFGMIMGIVHGSLLNKFGYRKCAIVAGWLVSIGVILTAFANTFMQFLIFYGFITSFGMYLAMSAFSLALNSYFKNRRSFATGFAVTIAGIGPVTIPLLISVLLNEYGTTGCVLIIGALALHIVIGGLLLQPLKWHLKKEIPEQELQEMYDDKGEISEVLINNKDYTKVELLEEKPKTNIEIANSTLSIDHDIETSSIYGIETPLPQRKSSVTSLRYDTGRCRKRSIFGRTISQQDRPDWQSVLSIHSQHSMKSIQEVDVEIPPNIPELPEQNKPDNTQAEIDKTQNILNQSQNKLIENSENKLIDNSQNKMLTLQNEDTESPVEKKKSRLKEIVAFLDLELLKDPIYLNLSLGMSLAVFAEINFALLTPFILHDFNLTTEKIAQFMATLSASDVVFRFMAPFLAQWLNKTPRIMYMCSLIFLMLTRISLIFARSPQALLAAAIILGMAKGVRTVFMALLIPSYVPIEKLASASGIQMVLNGIFMITGGPLLGVIRDITGSYDKCIICINCITFTTIIMWSIEFIYFKFCKKNTEN